ncbi:MAG: hypothetical protein BAJALOKI3v1_310024 [Promethearchaeota archaeon]|nr:MAG: hypothetical protein BAJALOKI3v1_310024 [Candidatus Lokiarchaeota archaeon]
MGTDSDKNISLILEKQLKTIGQKIRLDLLKSLRLSKIPLSFSDLQKSLLGFNNTSVNLSFHLKTLKEAKLIRCTDEGYCITEVGKEIFKKIIDIEHILNKTNKSLVIRTSKYSTEPFDIKNVKEYLIREAEMNAFVAEEITKLAEKKLSETNIDYLTAPLMREYINVILLEEGLEEYRHKLTRLGIPPFDAEQLFLNKQMEPEEFIKKVGSEASEQFLLLNLLPKELADLYLSNKIILLNLDMWALRPLSLFVNTERILGFYGVDIEDQKLALHFSNYLQKIMRFFSNNILLYNFDLISDHFNDEEEIFQFIDIFLFLMANFNNSNNCKLTLSFRNMNKNPNNNSILDYLLRNYLDSYCEESNSQSLPQLLLNYNPHLLKVLGTERLSKVCSSYNPIFCKDSNHLINHDIVNFNGDIKSPGKIVLDKILINLYSIARNSNRNDTQFFNILTQRLNSVFSFFNQKRIYMEKKIGNSPKSINHLFNLLECDQDTWIQRSIKSISFYGLNEAVKYHCGIGLERLDTSTRFAIKALKLMENLIDEKNDLDNENFYLSQPNFTPSKLTELMEFEREKKISGLIGNDTQLSLEQKIDLHNIIREHLKGGSLFILKKDSPDFPEIWKKLELLSSSKIPSFKFI